MLYGFLAHILTKRSARLDPDEDALNINKDATDLSGALIVRGVTAVLLRPRPLAPLRLPL